MYFYHGYAVGVASSVPGKEFSEAGCALSIRGGISAATSSRFNSQTKVGSPDPFLVTFDSAESSVNGREKKANGISSWTTEASVVVQNLDITGTVGGTSQEFFHADRLEAHVISQIQAGNHEPTISLAKDPATSSAKDPNRSGFSGLRIQGKSVTPVLSDDMFERYVTRSSMEQDFSNPFTKDRLLACMLGRGMSVANAGNQELTAAYETYKEQASLPSLKSAVIFSLVKNVGGIDSWGPIIPVPGFGTIYLGEVVAWPWMLCLTLFRIELASGETISGGSAGANGTTIPPGSHPPGEGL